MQFTPSTLALLVSIVSAALSSNGEDCNETIFPAKACDSDAGLSCVVTSRLLGASGTCECSVDNGFTWNVEQAECQRGGPSGAVGDKCNYSIHPALTCQQGLQCVTPSKRLGAFGTCQRKGQGLNQKCNMTVHPALACAEGLVCKVTSHLMGAPGVCVKA